MNALNRDSKDPRGIAFDVLRSVEERDSYADRTMDTLLKSLPDMDPRDRGLVTELVYGVLRRRGSLDLSLKPHLRRPLERLDPEILRILRLGAYQILFLDRVPDHAAVNESVTLAKRRGRPGAGALVNGCLRSLCRQKQGGSPGAIAPAAEPRAGKQRRPGPVPREGHPDGGGAQVLERLLDRAETDFPDWLADLWTRDLGQEKTRELFRSQRLAPATFLRVNPLRTSTEELVQRFGEQGFDARTVEELPGAVCIREGGDLRRSGAFREGGCVQQDAASQVIVCLLDPRPGERVLDLCAAPGIKTTQAAERMANQGLIVAVDINRDRLRDLAGLCSRMGVTIARPLCADPGKPDGLCLTGPPFDRILVDAPCSGLGILRRNPERKWRGAPDFAGLARLQRNMMGRAAGLLREGGVLVYSTCTVNRTENEEVVEAFLSSHSDFGLEHAAAHVPSAFRESLSAEGYFCSWVGPEFSDLFFAARLRKRPVGSLYKADPIL
jgi:16S rRNA (cytosine967-C5)-methyltransferase